MTAPSLVQNHQPLMLGKSFTPPPEPVQHREGSDHSDADTLALLPKHTVRRLTGEISRQSFDPSIVRTPHLLTPAAIGNGAVLKYAHLTWYPPPVQVVTIAGNNRTKASLIGQQAVVKRSVGLGGWHWLVR